MHEATPSRPSGPRGAATPRSIRPRPVAIVGPGRAGRAVGAALLVADWPVAAVAGRRLDAPSTLTAAGDLGAPARSVEAVSRGAEVVILAVPDDVIAAVARSVVGSADAGVLVIHVAGSRGLEVFGEATGLRPDVRYGALHPLVSIPTPDPGHLDGGWCAVAGDPEVYELAAALGLEAFTVADSDRARYHAAASIAANHVVALLSQVERLAERAAVPRAAFYPLVRGVVDNSEAIGPRDALTGPVQRGDRDTVDRHLAALAPEERALYRAMAAEALRLSGRDDPELEARLR